MPTLRQLTLVFLKMGAFALLYQERQAECREASRTRAGKASGYIDALCQGGLLRHPRSAASS